ncbi:MAG: ABC transporter permease subunit [Acidobacteria bacterium]|nr:ABC transporter permease subunit [Acidobacteriota bacterium]NIM60101.1 ABC transporter permease subunit [Acidobacteriota bacterium]NIO59459.1 ABC transporter permease subunit [Acidobacteriota bacterium]NIQ30490.1 ABC transporter permease subunit [Acidobacteriota bacterium]NIQ85429.1 ABC transporter permease subunit [Acidobacteriota bacterium]
MAERTGRPASLNRGLALVLVLGAIAVLAPLWAQDPLRIDLAATLKSPSGAHWLGTDALGRDLTARIAYGGRVSLGIGILTSLFSLAIGVPLGALAGFRGGWTDAAVSRLIETVACVPSLLLAIALLAMSPAVLRGIPDVLRVALVLAFAGWIPVARYMRGEFMRLKSAEMVEAARAAGASDLRIMVRHLLPSALAPVLVTASFAAASAILVEAALSFLGLGVQPPQPTWGGLLSDAREQIDQGWWLAVVPGLALYGAVLGFNLIGEGIRDRLDPRASTR